MNNRKVSILKEAILNEVEGYEFYKMASKLVDDPVNKEVFMMIAKDELVHIKYLKRVMKDIMSERSPEFKLETGIEVPIKETYNFKKLQKENLSKPMSIYSIAVDMETASIKFYQEIFVQLEDPEVKKLCKLLIDWEKMHRNLFLEQYGMSIEDWWNEQSFA